MVLCQCFEIFREPHDPFPFRFPPLIGSYGLYGDVPLNRVWFLPLWVWNRVYKSAFLSGTGYTPGVRPSFLPSRSREGAQAHFPESAAGNRGPILPAKRSKHWHRMPTSSKDQWVERWTVGTTIEEECSICNTNVRPQDECRVPRTGPSNAEFYERMSVIMNLQFELQTSSSKYSVFLRSEYQARRSMASLISSPGRSICRN